MAATPCLNDFFDEEILNAIEKLKKRIEPVQQPKDFFDEDFFDDEILNAIETEKQIEPVQQPKDFFDDEILNAIEKLEKRIEPVQQPFSMTAIPVMEAENIFGPEKMQVELPVCEPQNSACEPENSACLDDNELELLVEKHKNINTKKKTISDLKKWYTWCESVSELRKLDEIPPIELDRLLGHFFCKIRKMDNSMYEPDTLNSFQRSLDRHLTQELRKPYSIIRDTRFASSREKLKAAQKMLKREEKGNKSNAAEPLENSDIDVMWASGALGDTSPEILLNTVWFLLTLHMGMRGRDEHYKLTFGDFVIKSIPDGFKYVEFNERDTKTRSGETSASRHFKPKMWSTPDNQARCPVLIFEKFLQKCPPEMCKTESPFYLAVNYKHSTDDLWYKKQRMGKDRINTIMKRMAATSGLSGEKTNHSARKTMVTCLTKNNIPET